MPVNLSIKSVPDALVERLRARASRNNRSLQGELITILEESTGLRTNSMGTEEAIGKLRQLDFQTKADSVEFVRKDRDKARGR